jgi:hypothetical protein
MTIEPHYKGTQTENKLHKSVIMGISRKPDTNFRMKINNKLVKQLEKCIHLGTAKGKVSGKNTK